MDFIYAMKPLGSQKIEWEQKEFFSFWNSNQQGRSQSDNQAFNEVQSSSSIQFIRLR